MRAEINNDDLPCDGKLSHCRSRSMFIVDSYYTIYRVSWVRGASRKHNCGECGRYYVYQFFGMLRAVRSTRSSDKNNLLDIPVHTKDNVVYR
jgi:hypothetical protein